MVTIEQIADNNEQAFIHHHHEQQGMKKDTTKKISSGSPGKGGSFQPPLLVFQKIQTRPPLQ